MDLSVVVIIGVLVYMYQLVGLINQSYYIVVEAL